MRDSMFSPAFGNIPKTLVGRDQDIRILTEGLQALPGNKERARLIIGQRGLGKTVMMLELAKYARANGYIVASPTVVSSDMLDRILEKLERDGKRLLSHEKTKVTGGSVGFLGFSAGIQAERATEPKRSFAYQLLDFCEKANSVGKGILILVDEVQANHDALKKLIIAYQEAVGEGRNIAVVFAGLPAAVSRALNEHVLTFFNRAAKLYLAPIAVPEIELYFQTCFETIGIVLKKEWLHQAAEATEGSPYLMQLIGHYITAAASEHGELSEESWETAIRLAKDEFMQDICETTLSPLSERDRDFLKAMAAGEHESAVGEIAERLGVDSPYVQRYKTRLVQAGIIEQKRRGYMSFAVPYLREYLRKA